MAIEFDEIQSSEFSTNPSTSMSKERSKIVRALIKAKIVKDSNQAHILLLLFFVFALIISFAVIASVFKVDTVKYNLSTEVIKELPEDVQQKIYESNKK